MPVRQAPVREARVREASTSLSAYLAVRFVKERLQGGAGEQPPFTERFNRLKQDLQPFTARVKGGGVEQPASLGQ